MILLNDPSASQIARERNIFPSPVSQTYSEGSKVTTLSPCFFFYFAWVSCNTVACVNCISTHFPWYFLGGGEEDGPCYTFSSFLFWEGHRGGDGTSTILCICLHLLLVKKIDSVKLKSPSYFPVQSFLLFPCFLVKPPSLLSRDFPATFFLFNFFFLLVSCFYTVMPFQIVLLTSELWKR